MALSVVMLSLAVGQRAVPPKKVDDSGPVRLMPDGSPVLDRLKRVTMKSRPVDLVSVSATVVAVKDNEGVKFVDLAASKVVAEWKSNDGMSAVGLAVAADGTVWTTTNNKYLVGVTFDGAKATEAARIDLGDSYPNGVALDGTRAFVALSTKNQVAEVDLTTKAIVRKLDVGIAPFAVAVSPDRVFVTQQGGVPPTSGLSAPSAGSAVSVDERGIATAGALAVIDRSTWKVARQVSTGTLPSAVVFDAAKNKVLVACANSDMVVEVDPSSGTTSGLPLNLERGAAPTGLALKAGRLLVALSGLNSVVQLDRGASGWSVTGRSTTDWFPVAVAWQGSQWAVANTKGLGSRSARTAGVLNSYDYTGSVNLLTSAGTPGGKMSDRKFRKMPPIKHVVYVIKENRTYDQVFGDIQGADGEPKLCQFGANVTPNQHAIVRNWVLLDNYYCSGVLSADGHSWATEGNSTPYLERSFGGFKRSYTFGDDPLTYSQTGFVWDGVLAKGLTFRNYGEFDYAGSADGLKDADLYAKSLTGVKLNLSSNIGVKRVKDYSCPGYPGWNMAISDQYRMDRWIEDFEKIKASGDMPSLMMVYLPQDHTGGPVSPVAHVADNDYAVGRLIEALSHSSFWKDTVVFVNEDDPQAGTDHVDGHRSTCLVAGGYVKKGAVVSNFHSQASVLHTIDLIFGIPVPTNKTRIAPAFDDVWADTPDLTPFTAIRPAPSLTARVPATNPYYRFVAGLDLREREVQTPAQMDALNRAIWSSVRPGEQYPAEWAGAHGRGLAAKQLVGVRDADD
jgi:phospholipase C